MGNVKVKMSLSQEKTGALYFRWRTLVDEKKAIAKAIHYPKCWDTSVYPTLLDAIKKVGSDHENCAIRG